MTTNTIPHPADALPLPEGWPARFRCDSCEGNGEIGEPMYMGHFQPPERARCHYCDGRGWTDEEPAFNSEHIRAAHREGYELAMSKRAAPLSRDQIDKIMTKHYPLDSLLRESVDAFEACVRDIEAALAAPAQEQPAFKIYKGDVCYKSAEEDQSFGMWCPVSTAYQPTFPEGTEFYATAQPKQQQAGAAEVSDEQIDEVLLFETGFDGFGTQEMNSDDLRRVCRAVLALKTAGGVA